MLGAGYVARMEEGRDAFKILADKPKRKRSLRRSTCTWEDNIRTDFKEIGVNTTNLIDWTLDNDC